MADADLEWAEDDDYSVLGTPTKVEPGAGVKAEGQLTTTANVSAQELNWQVHRLSRNQNGLVHRDLLTSFRVTALNSGLTDRGAAAFEAAGVWIAVGSTGNWAAIPLCYPGDATTFASGALTGPPTITSEAPSAVTDSYVVFVYAGYSYRFSTSLSGDTRAAFADITAAHGIIWSEYGNQFIAIGTDAGSAGTIEVSAAASSWAEKTDGRSTNNGYDYIACDPTGQYVLVSPLLGDDWAYSEDGGATWAVYTVAVDSDTAFTLTGLAYDSRGERWLATVNITGFSGDARDIFASSDPTTSWASLVQAPARGLQGEAIAAACGICVIDDTWLVGSGSSSYFNILVTRDQGSTWTALGNPDNTYDHASAELLFHRSGSYVFLTDQGIPGYIIGPVGWS